MRISKRTPIFAWVALGVMILLPLVIGFLATRSNGYKSLNAILLPFILFLPAVIGALITVRITNKCPKCDQHLKLRSRPCCGLCAIYASDFARETNIHFINPQMISAKLLMTLSASIGVGLLITSSGAVGKRLSNHFSQGRNTSYAQNYLLNGIPPSKYELLNSEKDTANIQYDRYRDVARVCFAGAALLFFICLWFNVEVFVFPKGILWMQGLGPLVRKKWIQFEEIESIKLGDFTCSLTINAKSGTKFKIPQDLVRVQGSLAEVPDSPYLPSGTFRDMHRLKAEIERRTNQFS